jgi:tRNA-modifying protein YgfZ
MTSPLLAAPGAVPADGPDSGVAAHYGDPYAEQRALAGSAGLVDRSHRGVIRITGPDRLSWLHSITTQSLDKLAAGDTAEALILSPNGHVEHQLTLTDDGTAVWAHVEPGTAGPLLEFLESMRFMLRVEPADVSGDYAVLTVMGPGAPRVPPDAAAATLRAAFQTDFVVARPKLADVSAGLQAGGAALAGMWAYEALRIAAHRPRLGLDTDHRTIPHEMGWIETAVHLSKGCYRGQETVARVHNLGHPPRRLVFLHLDGSEDALPGHGDAVELDGTRVGFTGSAARHYELGPIALALIKRTVPVDAVLSAAGIAASQEVIVPPDAGANVKITLRRPRGDLQRARE